MRVITPTETLDAEKILSIVDTLSEEKQKIIKMRFWEDLKFSEIAENLNKSEDAVKKMFYRTIEELKNKF
ncbi:MAG: sigma-70 region 4 domain-containing protein [Ignavibacteriales bacterium]|nr:sigma-70 region 4 domain-containing protein [Ignavibacteriales bacterium]